MQSLPICHSSSLNKLVSTALDQLEERGFSARSRKYCRSAWHQFLQFAASQAKNVRVKETDTDFLLSLGIVPGARRRDLTWSQDVARRGMRILGQIQETGEYQSCDKPAEKSLVCANLLEIHNRYEAFCQDYLHLRSSTIASHRHVLKLFLTFLTEHNVVSFHKFYPTLLNTYVSKRAHQLKASSLASQVGCIRSFLRFLCMEGIVEAQLIAHARTLRFPAEHRLPPILPKGSAEVLISAVDRSSVVGKRDYAIILLAARLGLRACDIRALRIDNIQWKQDRLNVIQPKTGKPLSLPLSEEIGSALIDYLAHARPPSKHRQVFLKVRAPHDPVCSTNPFYSVITSTLNRADINLPDGMP